MQAREISCPLPQTIAHRDGRLVMGGITPAGLAQESRRRVVHAGGPPRP
jgi:hypothetical protein